MKLNYKNKLLFIDLEIEYGGSKKTIKDVVLDTGASHTIISPDVVGDIGIAISPEDEMVTMYGIGGEQYAFRKKVDSIIIGNHKVKNIYIDFGIIDEDGIINGLIGLDILVLLGANINLKDFTIEFE